MEIKWIHRKKKNVKNDETFGIKEKRLIDMKEQLKRKKKKTNNKCSEYFIKIADRIIRTALHSSPLKSNML